MHISDHTVDDGRDLLWVGVDGMEGRWLKPEEALEFAHALESIAHAHIDRVFWQLARASAALQCGRSL
jgi:hypothetical protein